MGMVHRGLIMPKSSRKQIDKDEKKVISELQKNAKESIDVIANKCGFSRQKVWRIIKRLEENKTIWTYHAVIDQDKIGLQRYLILLKRNTTSIPADSIEMAVEGKISDMLQEMNINVEYAYYLNGCFDFAVEVTALDVRDLKKMTETLNKLFREYISDIQVLEVIFPMIKCGTKNPNLSELRTFFIQ